MSKPITLACSALALCVGLSLAPAAQAAGTGDGTSKMSGDAMMNKGGMKKTSKHKNGMMNSGAMMKKVDAAPAQQSHTSTRQLGE